MSTNDKAFDEFSCQGVLRIGGNACCEPLGICISYNNEGLMAISLWNALELSLDKPGVTGFEMGWQLLSSKSNSKRSLTYFLGPLGRLHDLYKMTFSCGYFAL